MHEDTSEERRGLENVKPIKSTVMEQRCGNQNQLPKYEKPTGI